MKNKNKNNSIVFLTTLSVYLGLVLVGGGLSPVLAQAATTRNFNVQDELEVKDDLDNKPNDSEVGDSSERNFPALFIQLLSEIKNEVESGNFSAPVSPNFIINAQYSSGICSSGTIGLDFADQDFGEAVAKIFSEKFDSKIFKILDSNDGKSKSAKVRIEANNSELSLNISFAKSNAAPFAAFLNREFSLSALSAENFLITQLYENTKSTSENDQVFIVTRLPRGSLDELLKQNAKAENK